MKNFLTRSLTGFLYLIVFIAALLSGEFTFAALFLVISMISLWEFYNMAELKGYQPARYPGMFLGATLFLLIYYICAYNKSIALTVIIIPVVVYIFIAELYRNQSDPLANISLTLLGVIYIILPLSLFNKFAFYPDNVYNYQIIFGFFILMWINDTAAYIFGISFGKHRLFERISPKKSWEGFIGGTLITLVASYFMISFFQLPDRSGWIIIGLIISIAGVFGDLVESMLKRAVGLKDSGKLLPGHGGMLDRIDSALLSSPLVFVYLIIINNFKA